MTAETFGQMLLRLRTDAGLLQADLGAKIGVTGTSISNWEKDINAASYDHVRKLADVLAAPELLEKRGFIGDPLASMRSQLEHQAEVLDELRRGQDELRQIVAELRSAFEGS